MCSCITLVKNCYYILNEALTILAIKEDICITQICAIYKLGSVQHNKVANEDVAKVTKAVAKITEVAKVSGKGGW